VASSIVVSNSGTLPTAPTGGGLLTNYYLGTTCSSSVAWNFVPSTCNAVAGAGISFTCSGTQESENFYVSSTCSGSPYASNAYYTYYTSCTATSTSTISVLNPAYGGKEFGATYVQQTCQASPPGPAPAPAPATKNSCFAGSETLQYESGEVKAISEARVGDRVLSYSPRTAEFTYSDIIAVPHRANEISAQFEHIVLASGKDIKMTSDHLVQSGSCDLPARLTMASNVKVGDCLQTVEGPDVVVDKTQVEAKGIYTVVTQNEYVVVNNVVASPFAWNHEFINTFYGLHRAIFATAPAVLKSSAFQFVQSFYGNVADFVSEHVQFAL